MNFSRKQIIFGLIIIMCILVGILYFMNKNEGFLSLSNQTTTPFDPSTSLFYLLYKKYPTSSASVYEDLSNNLDKYINNKNIDIHVENFKTFKRRIETCIDDYQNMKNKDKALVDLKDYYKTINTNTNEIQDSFKERSTATKQDWNNYINSMFTNKNFLNHIFIGEPFENPYNIYISDVDFNNILYDTTINDSKKIIRLANYINAKVPGLDQNDRNQQQNQQNQIKQIVDRYAATDDTKLFDLSFFPKIYNLDFLKTIAAMTNETGEVVDNGNPFVTTAPVVGTTAPVVGTTAPVVGTTAPVVGNTFVGITTAPVQFIYSKTKYIKTKN